MRARYMNLDAKRMAVQPPALVMLGKIRQTMRRLNGELFEDVHKLLRELLPLRISHADS